MLVSASTTSGPLLPGTVALLTLSLLGVSPATAFTPVAPSNIKAGTDTVLRVNTVPADYADYKRYNTYLAAATPDGGNGPICLLVNDTAIPPSKDGHADITVNIPASVGPAGVDAYRIVLTAYSFLPDPNLPGNSSSLVYSDRFSLDGGDVQWSKYESDHSMMHFLTFENFVPCTAYDCTRQCNMRFYPGNTRDIAPNERFHPETYRSTYDCVAACPGVTYKPWSEVLDEGVYQQDVDGVRGEGYGNATLTLSLTTATATGTVARTADISSAGMVTTTVKSVATRAAQSSASGNGNSAGASTPVSSVAPAAATSSVHSAAAVGGFTSSLPTSLLALLPGFVMIYF